ncbi:uncharacterized protein LOC106170084 isoform X2 [Lingula anatina]|nr:uncharacterized protein LOC106170084 isoform X2 [Lingula anatina]|eukprot:XP_013405278.1 uncharacterized protein LOC106170084 isoform X2 [Lingula anatina]
MACLVKYKQLQPNELTNEQALEIYKEVSSKRAAWQDVRNVLKIWDSYIQDIPSNYLSLSFHTVKTKRAKLKKSKRDLCKLTQYLSEPFVLLLKRDSRVKGVQRKGTEESCEPPVDLCEPPTKRRHSDQRQADASGETVQKLGAEVKLLQQKVKTLLIENSRLRKENGHLQDHVDILKRKCSVYNPRRVNLMIKRKEKSICLWKEKCRKLQISAAKGERLQEKLESLKREKKQLKWAKSKQASRIRAAKKAWKSKKEEITKNVQAPLVKTLTEKNNYIKLLKEGLCDLEHQVDILQERCDKTDVT